MKRSLAILLATSFLAFPALAEGPTVKEIDVTVDMGAVENAEAAAYWGKLEGDLEAAILANLTGQVADDGAKISVDISEVELANGFAQAAGIGNAVLKGNVVQTHDSDNSRFNSYELMVDVKAAAPALGEGFDPAAADVDTARVYKALVDTFAANVAAAVK